MSRDFWKLAIVLVIGYALYRTYSVLKSVRAAGTASFNANNYIDPVLSGASSTW